MSSTQPLVTIGIPTFNRAAANLKNAIQCALGQTYTNIEIIVSDNCSEDDTENAVKSFTDSRLRYYKQPQNIGANNNFNYCIEQARGVYFLLLHDDDMIDSDFIESCISATNGNNNIGIIRTGTRLIDSTGNSFSEIPNPASDLTIKEFFLAWFDNKITLYLCSTLFNTAGLKEIGGFHSKHDLFQDVVAEAKLAAKYGREDVYDVKASFRRHDENRGSAATITAWCEDSLELLDVICDQVPTDSDLIRNKGLEYFHNKMYQYASRLQSPLHRMKEYIGIYKSFNYMKPPFKFIYDTESRRCIRKLTKLLPAYH